MREGPRDAVVNPLDERIAAVAGCIGHHNANDAGPFPRSGTPEDLAEAWGKAAKGIWKWRQVNESSH